MTPADIAICTFLGFLVSVVVAYALGRAHGLDSGKEERRDAANEHQKECHTWSERLRFARTCHLRTLGNIRALQGAEKGALDQYLVIAINNVPTDMSRSEILPDVV